MELSEDPSKKGPEAKMKLEVADPVVTFQNGLPRLNHEVLFLHKFSDLKAAQNQESDYSLLSAAAILRHLLLDGLLSEANLSCKLDLTFPLPEEVPQEDAFTAEGFVFWQRSFSGEEKRVSLVEFLDADCLVIGESGPKAERFSVRDVVKLCANVLGGIHHQARGRNERRTRLAWLYYGGNSMILFGSDKHMLLQQLERIIEVAVAGVEPLNKTLLDKRPDWRSGKIVLN